jgi:hypothetical protein
MNCKCRRAAKLTQRWHEEKEPNVPKKKEEEKRKKKKDEQNVV